MSGALVVLSGDTDPAELDALRAHVEPSGLVALLAVHAVRRPAGPSSPVPVVQLGPDTSLMAAWATVRDPSPLARTHGRGRDDDHPSSTAGTEPTAAAPPDPPAARPTAAATRDQASVSQAAPRC